MRALMLSLALTTTLTIAAPAAAHTTPHFKFTQENVPNNGNIIIYLNQEGEAGELINSINDKTDGRLMDTLKRHKFKAKFGKSMSFKSLAPFDTVTVIGAGDERLDKRALIDLGGKASANSGDKDTVIIANDLDSAEDSPAAFLAKGFALRSYSFEKYQEGYDADAETPSVSIISNEGSASDSLYSNDLTHVVEGIYKTRDLGSEPGNKIYPQSFVDAVKPMFKGLSNVEIQVLEADDIRREGMGALMGVGKGSINDPRLLVISYTGAPSNEAPLALVGKGITFDTGGISLKSNNNMWMMKADLSGAAAVAGTVFAAAKRGEEINLVGLMPLAENMPAMDAIRPGDVLTTMGGKTIEVMSTDAEGRLVLADAVQYAQKEFDPYMLVDIATLTGSASRALGSDYAAVISRDIETSLDMMEIGKRAGEDVWPLPLRDSHFDQIKSNIADIKGSGGNPGASIGAAVIGTFIDKDLPWVHLDIAGVDWANSSNATTPKGHAGWGIRFLDELVREEARK